MIMDRNDFRKTAEADFFQDIVDELISTEKLRSWDKDCDRIDVTVLKASVE
jgi:hypothetical protein